MGKTRSNCIYHCDKDRQLNGCYLLYDAVYCNPETCSWHTTHQQRIDSYVRAVRSWEQRHPGKRWDEHSSIVPKEFQYDVRKAIRLAEIK